MELIVKPKKKFQAAVPVPGDKSISHRSVIIGAIADGVTEIENFLPGQDCLSTVQCMRQLGVDIEQINDTHFKVYGKGVNGLKEPDNVLDVGNSGTTMRLLTGLLSAQGFFTTLTGDASIRRRPMERVAIPLRKMGAQIQGRAEGKYAPLAIAGGPLRGIEYHTPVVSAQLKSAILLAGLYAEGETMVTEPAQSRDHTEKMLAGFGASIQSEGLTTTIRPGRLRAQKTFVPGDISSAAFLLVAAAIVPGARITAQKVGINQTRTGILDVLSEMGASISIENQMESSGELLADITVEGTELRGTCIGGDIVPRLIDEIPVLAVAAAAASGKTVIKDAAELKVKESNRLRAITVELRRFGVDIAETEDGLIINGGGNYSGAVCESYHDHRIAMSCALMGLISSGQTVIRDAECISVSFPGFEQTLNDL
ncbi:MAG: 3-phosphoshikimate 1-carboxyvinyltransferase [Bacillota bacterium]|nr:3-phosphoshikimate 1-carboxyvinyltransferase [Bacillota bacterium]